ncbi:MAG: hypothetical protein ACO3SP_10115 [Ilumatobacteraceae bacterium]
MVSALRQGLIAYAISRIAVLIGAAIVGAEMRADHNRIRERFIWGSPPRPDPHSRYLEVPRSAVSMILDVLTSWDGIWYMRIVRYGYPVHVPPNITYDDTQARVAFFPAYPYLVRVVDRILPGGDTAAALATNFLLGAVFVVLVGFLAREWFGDEAMGRAMIVVALFPGSLVLSLAYSEALLLALAAACLLLLQRQHWVLAGLVAALATGARPNGVALVAACAVAGIVAARQSRSWRPLIAPLLAPWGFVAVQIWIDHHTGEKNVWFRVQGEAWKEGASFGLTAIRRTLEAFTQPLTSPTDVITAVSFVTTLVVVWIAWRKHKLPPAAAAYSAVVVALMLLPATVTARPRFLFTAFPLLIAASVWLGAPRRANVWPYLVGFGLMGLSSLTALYGVYAAIP